jgi:hypothetical protein
VKEHTGYLVEGFNSQFAQVLADRAFDTIEKVLYGKAKNVRFKGKWDNILVSINSKQTATGFFFNADTLSVTYRSLTIPIVTEYRNDNGYHKWYLQQIAENIQKHAAVDLSYIRIVRRVIKGEDIFYAQCGARLTV